MPYRTELRHSTGEQLAFHSLKGSVFPKHHVFPLSCFSKVQYHAISPNNCTMHALLLPSSVFSCFTAPEKLHISSSVPGSCLTFTWSDLKVMPVFSAVLPDDPQLEKEVCKYMERSGALQNYNRTNTPLSLAENVCLKAVAALIFFANAYNLRQKNHLRWVKT